jgi:hypothetical protein
MTDEFGMDKYADDLEITCALCGYLMHPPIEGVTTEEWQYVYCSKECYDASKLLDEDLK